jgi:hypothetical protein
MLVVVGKYAQCFAQDSLSIPFDGIWRKELTDDTCHFAVLVGLL